MDPLNYFLEWLTTIDIHCHIVIQFRHRENVLTAERSRTFRNDSPAPGASRYKLMPAMTGPYKIIEITSPVTVRIDQKKTRCKEYHSSHIKNQEIPQT